MCRKSRQSNLTLEHFPEIELFQIQVSAEDFVPAFTGQQHLYALLTGMAGDEVVGNRASDQGGIEGFQMINHLGQGGQDGFQVHDQLMMIRTDMIGHDAGVFDILAFTPHPGRKF